MIAPEAYSAPNFGLILLCRFAQAIADGCAQTIFCGQRAKDDGAVLGIESAQAGVQIVREFFECTPASPGKQDNIGGSQRVAVEFRGQHDADFLSGMLGRYVGKLLRKAGPGRINQNELGAWSVVTQSHAGRRQGFAGRSSRQHG